MTIQELLYCNTSLVERNAEEGERGEGDEEEQATRSGNVKPLLLVLVFAKLHDLNGPLRTHQAHRLEHH